MKPTRTLGCLLFAALAFAPGCSRRMSERTRLVCVVDLTGSIEPDARAQAFDALRAAFKMLRRGDELSIIPVTGDAVTEGQGQILRFKVSEKRSAYDSDLRRLAADVSEKLEKLEAEALEHPYNRSDILGATSVASEELAGGEGGARRVLVVLSDFIQEDSRYDFARDPRMKSDDSARALAGALWHSDAEPFRGVSVYVGLLRSNDLKSLPEARRSAVKSFWTEFFRSGGASSISYATDGTGQLAKFVSQAD